LIDLIVKTHKWFGKIASGEVLTACDEGLDERDASRFLPRAFLAPDSGSNSLILSVTKHAGVHIFDHVCSEHGIDHRLTKIKYP
tara:strand:- start:203 stop:454 length:252 start_codon:yes stop_codon:yes gene_type:complete